MTLPELLVSSVILASSSYAALQVWTQSTTASLQGQRQEEASERLHAQLLAAQRQLHTHIAQQCPTSPEQIGQVLEALPLSADLERGLQTDGSTDGVWLAVRQPSSGVERRRLFTIAGLGGCSTSATPASPATEEHAEAHEA